MAVMAILMFPIYVVCTLHIEVSILRGKTKLTL